MQPDAAGWIQQELPLQEVTEMKCKHENIRVYEEITYHGTLDADGIVHYNSNAPEGVYLRDCTCMDCDEEFDDPQNDEQEQPHQPAAPSVTIPLYRTVPSITGIGWIAVERWDHDRQKYTHRTSCRSQEQANEYIAGWTEPADTLQADMLKFIEAVAAGNTEIDELTEQAAALIYRSRYGKHITKEA